MSDYRGPTVLSVEPYCKVCEQSSPWSSPANVSHFRLGYFVANKMAEMGIDYGYGYGSLFNLGRPLAKKATTLGTQ